MRYRLVEMMYRENSTVILSGDSEVIAKETYLPDGKAGSKDPDEKRIIPSYHEISPCANA